jgi:alpha-glucosidase
MQWDTSANAGFSTGKPWLPVPPGGRDFNVAVESQDPESLLNFYKRLIALRRSQSALRIGHYAALNPDDPRVFSYLRKTGDARHAIIVALNMSSDTCVISFDLGALGYPHASLKAQMVSPSGGVQFQEPGRVSLPAFGVFIGEVARDSDAK